MLKQIKCNLFNQTPIEFHSGLNIILGVCVRPSHLPNPVKPGHGVHLNLGGHQF